MVYKVIDVSVRADKIKTYFGKSLIVFSYQPYYSLSVNFSLSRLWENSISFPYLTLSTFVGFRLEGNKFCKRSIYHMNLSFTQHIYIQFTKSSLSTALSKYLTIIWGELNKWKPPKRDLENGLFSYSCSNIFWWLFSFP